MNYSSGLKRWQPFFELKYLKAVFIISLICYLFLFIVRIFMVFSYDAEFTGIDNNFIYPVVRMLAGYDIYPKPEDYPFAINPYAPLLFYVSYFFCNISGIAHDDTIQVYFTTRLICLTTDILTTWILYRILVRHLNISRTMALFGTTGFFYLISYWSYTAMRSDSLILMFYSLAIYLLLEYISRRSKWLLFLLACVCNAAIFSKQNAVYIPFMIFGILLVFRYYRHATWFFLYWLSTFGLLMWLFTMVYPDGNFFNHLVRALNNRIDLRWFYINIFKRLVQEFIVIPFGFGLWIAIRKSLSIENKKIQTLGICALASTIFGLTTALKWGSGMGYLHESFFCITCLLVFSVSHSGVNLLKRFFVPVVGVTLLIFFHILTQLYLYHLNDYSEEKTVYTRQKNVSTELMKEIGTADYHIYVDDVNGTYFKNMLHKRIVLPNKDAVDCCTLPDKNFDYSLLKEGFNNGKIKYLIFRQGVIPGRFHDMGFEHYTKSRTLEGYDIYTYSE